MGHIHPLMPIALALKDAGHDVVWATGSEACQRVESYGFKAISAGMSPDERRQAFPGPQTDVSAVHPRQRRALIFGKRFGGMARSMREDLAPIVDSLHPDLIVHDLAEFAAAPIAVARDIAHVTVAFSGALSGSLLQGVVDVVADVWSAEGLAVPSDVGLYDHLYLHRFPLAFSPIPANSKVRSVRPVGFDGGVATDPPAWIAALGVNRPAVYATLGTVFSNVAQWRELVAALGSLNIDAVATIGSQIDPAEIGEIPANVRVERYIPQSFILERATVLISHAGAGSMLAGASLGLAQLCVPMGADQWDNADAVQAAGAGITLEEDQRDAVAIGVALERLLASDTFTLAAKRVADEIAALPHPDAYVRTFESLAGY